MYKLFLNMMVLAGLLCVPNLAMAGWMDQLGGMLEQSTGNKNPIQSNKTLTKLSHSEIDAGLKDALRVGSEKVVSQLSKKDGFNKDSQIHIPLPKNLQTVKSALGRMGMGSMMNDLELRLNRAAEAATPKAKKIFGHAIKAMTITDAEKILKGPDDAATQYFKGKMSKPLADEMRPMIQQALKKAGAIKAYDSVMGQYQSLPFMPDVKANLTRHVLDFGLKGVFHYMAVEEKEIRKNPVKRTTQILKKVFGSR
ncbi:MAG: DUF4197 domain-containing protein [Mariprofundaceae bacterium]